MVQSDSRFSFLTLNLHCYQEADQHKKFGLVADFIVANEIDVICFQEAAQNRSSDLISGNIRSDNAVLIIQNLVAQKSGINYEMFWDWSHYGWDIWEEGLAILSRHPILRSETKYLTTSNSKTDWLSRIGMSCLIQLPNGSELQILNTHLGWFDDPSEPYENQVKNLLHMVSSESALIMGDFNLAAGTAEYGQLKNLLGFEDLYLNANPEGMFDPTIGGNIDGWQERGVEGMRIDYAWLAPESEIEVTAAEIVFYELGEWLVSDHAGVYFEIEVGLES